MEENDPLGLNAYNRDFYPYLWHRFYALHPEFMDNVEALDTVDDAFEHVNHRLSKREDNDEEIKPDDKDTFTR